MDEKEDFPHFQGFDPSIITRSSPPNRLLRRRHSIKQFERSDFADSTIKPPIGISPSLSNDISTPIDPLDPILPNPQRKLLRRKSDTSIVAQYYRNFDELPSDLPRSSRLRRNQPENIKTTNLSADNNNNPTPLSCPSKGASAKTIFDDILRIKETFEDNKPTNQKKTTKTRRQLYVDEFDETPKIITERSGNSDGENSRDGIKEWETSPRKSDLRRSLRNQKDLDAF